MGGYIGKVTKFGLFKIIIFRSNCHFLVGGGGKRQDDLDIEIFIFRNFVYFIQKYLKLKR